ncbi:dihydrofolate reductase [Sphaerotilaceae bacterium SBD11-9]
MTRPTLSLIAAVARNGVIGHDNALLWRLPEDMQYFKRTTHGFPVIMGRKTWDSVPARFRPLPGRRNIVVTRNREWRAEGADTAHSLQQALALAGDAEHVFVIGGAQLYAEALPLAERLVLTEIDRDYQGETRFPAWNRAEFREVQRDTHHSGEPNHFDYAFVIYQRQH